ncbi:hypothetical protein D3C73_1609310 [compost metagenome]
MLIRMPDGPPKGKGLARPDEQGMQLGCGKLQIENLVLLINHIKACMGVIQRTARFENHMGQVTF